MEKAFKYRIYPNKTQQVLIQKTFGCVRFVYNYYLDKNKQLYEENKGYMTAYTCSADLTKLKKELTWLQEPDKWALQNVLKDLDASYHNFFKKQSHYPKYKSKKTKLKKYRTTFTNNNIVYDNRHIKLPKLGWVKTKDRMIPQGRILYATIVQERNNHYYCILCCTDIEIKPLPKTNETVGIDLGLTDFAVFSNSIKIANPEHFEKQLTKLVKLNRQFTRKTSGGSNWEKNRIKIAKLYKKITEQKQDFIHKLTTTIVKQYDVICIEDLDLEGLQKQKFGFNPLTRTRHRHFNDVSFYEFKRQLIYKCKWYGKELIMVDTKYPSSQICHICGNRSGHKRESIRIWECPCCGEKLDRDLNAAINILNEGLRIQISA